MEELGIYCPYLYADFLILAVLHICTIFVFLAVLASVTDFDASFIHYMSMDIHQRIARFHRQASQSVELLMVSPVEMQGN